MMKFGPWVVEEGNFEDWAVIWGTWGPISFGADVLPLEEDDA